MPVLPVPVGEEGWVSVNGGSPVRAVVLRVWFGRVNAWGMEGHEWLVDLRFVDRGLSQTRPLASVEWVDAPS